MSAASTRAVEISRNLRGLLGARISVATTEAARALPAATKTAEAAAVDDLTAIATTHGPTFVKIGGPREFDPNTLRGMTMEDVRASVPADWDRVPSRSGGGEIFRDPENGGRRIRIMPGYEAGSRPDPLTYGPYVVVSQNGAIVKIPLFGNPTLS
jgi:hypothetical protein